MGRSFPVWLGLLIAFSTPTVFAQNPWEELMGPGKPRIWTDPQARFYLDLPLGWEAKPNGQVVNFWKKNVDNGFVAHVTVELRPIPPDVKLAHFDHRVETEVKSVAPGYTLRGIDRVQISGGQGQQRHFTYRERGNAQLVNEVVEVVFLVGERAFIMTLETALGTREHFWADFEKMRKGFVGRAPGDESMPLPKQRRRIKAGEMVNPDAVKY